MAEATTEGKRMVSYDELIRAKNALESVRCTIIYINLYVF